jgi:hypothetical protein
MEELKSLEENNPTKNVTPEFYFTEISPIQIYIQSNIPNKEPLILKRSNFIINFERPSSAEDIKDYSDLPFFTNEVEYPTNSLYKMEPYEIYDFFFSRSYFEYKLNYIIFQNTGKGLMPPNDPDIKRRNEYNKKNIMTMLQLLFTTVYPRTNNITNSIDEYIRKQATPLNINRIMSKPTYTYVKIDGNEYTLMKLIWLNDIFNHPKYNKLVDEFINYKNWCTLKSKTIQKKIDDNITKMNNLIDGFEFKKLKEELKKKIEQTQDPSKVIAITFEKEIYLSNVKKIAETIENLDNYKNNRNVESQKEKLFEMLDNLDEIYNKVKSYIGFSSTEKSFIESLIKLYKIILPIKSINTLYLKEFKIDIQNKNLSLKDSKNELKPYIDFVNVISNYLFPTMESSNTKLQSIITKYADNINKDSEIFLKLMDTLNTCYSDKKPKCKVIKNKQQNEAIFNFIDTGINYINLDNSSKPQYEIFVQANFISGHLDNNNWANIKCNFNDEVLTNKFNSIFGTKQLVGDWIVTPGPFVNINPNINPDNKKAEVPPAKAAEPPSEKTQTSNSKKKKKGGKYKTRRVKNNIGIRKLKKNRTRRLYKYKI